MDGRRRDLKRGLRFVLALICATSTCGAVAGLPATAAGANVRPDLDFGHRAFLAGIGRVDPNLLADQGHAAVARNGDIFLATSNEGSSHPTDNGQPFEVKLWRLHPDGRPDQGFGQEGVVTVALGGSRTFSLTGLLLDSAGRPILIGTSYSAPTTYVGPYPLGYIYPSFATAVRYESDGQLDRSFGNGDGVAAFDFGLPVQPPYEKPAAFVKGGGIDASGRIYLVVGQQEIGGDGPRPQFLIRPKLVSRLAPSGALDTTFGEGGVARLDEVSSTGDVAVSPAGQLTAVVNPDGAKHFTANATLLRLTPAGVRDARFGPDGLRTYAGVNDPKLAESRSRRLLMLGATTMSHPRRSSTVIERIGPNGSLDRSFGRHGAVGIHLPGPSYLSGIRPDHRGGAYLLGTYLRREGGVSWENAVHEFALVHLLPSGKRDPHFGKNGIVATRWPGSQIDAGASWGFLAPNHRLLVVGLARWPSIWPWTTFALTRYVLSG